MFRKKGDATSAPVETMISKECELMGSLAAKGSLRVDGKVAGDVTTDGDVLVGEGGLIEGDIQAQNVILAGTVRGNLKLTGKLELYPTAHLTGDVKVAVLNISDGAFFNGTCEMEKIQA